MTTPSAAGTTPAGSSGDKSTTTVRVQRELARRARVVATHDDTSVSDLISPKVRTWITAQYQRVREQMAAELRGETVPHTKPIRQGGEKGTATVQIEADLAKMLAVVCAHDGVSSSQLLSPQLAKWLEKEYARVQREMGGPGGSGPAHKR